MIRINKLWADMDEGHKLRVLNRPRISYEVDEYILRLIEKHILIPKKIMQSEKYDYELTFSPSKFGISEMNFLCVSPYNPPLKDGVVLSTPITKSSPHRAHMSEFIKGERVTTWFNLDYFSTYKNIKDLFCGVKAKEVDENITPREYADLLFDTLGANLIFNFKKLKKSDFDELKKQIDYDVINSFVYPAPFELQRYSGDNTETYRTRIAGLDLDLDEVPHIKEWYKKHYNEV